MITKSGVLRPSRNSSLITSLKNKRLNETEVAGPVIQGTFTATKLNMTKVAKPVLPKAESTTVQDVQKPVVTTVETIANGNLLRFF